jgi:hypothetical protein
MKKTLVIGLLSALAASAVLATTVFACTNFLGTFTVKGSTTGTGTVTATGTDSCTWNTPPTPPSHCSFKMAQTLSGTTFAPSGTGTFDITWTVPTGGEAEDLPTAYDVNFHGGDAYDNFAVKWKIDCMDGSSGITKVGSTVLSNSTGLLTGTTHFSLPSGSTANAAGQESAVCISDSAANFGNEAPIALS